MTKVSKCSLKVVYTTVDKLLKAEALAMKAVSLKHVSCVNIHPNVTSIYSWKGAIEKGEEVSLMFKVTDSHLNQFLKWLDLHHPYDDPSVLVYDVEAVNLSSSSLSA
ncbi:MAG: divalent-cation tolerance protein CutA [Alphaproteobacteria bacterium]|nr:MAG: divalent-cation tolerance protein CutA [Alphaproteobacteria bacterium]